LGAEGGLAGGSSPDGGRFSEAYFW